MRYIGPFFRMNKLSPKEITGQLFHLSKEALKTIVLESKCGIVDSIKRYKKISSNIDITTSGNFSPLLCLYRKSSPNYIHSKNYNGFDEESFKKDIYPITNALMTTSMLNLSTYYSKFKDADEKLFSYSEIYKKLAREQLNFYSSNLRNTEGVFVEKRNLSENNYKEFNLSNKNNKFRFSDQAFMMVAYNLYSTLFSDDDISKDFERFAEEILQVLIEFKNKIYETSFEEISKILLAVNIYYSNSLNEEAKILIVDLTDYLINKFEEKDYYVDSLDYSALFAINLMFSFKHTQMITFKEKAQEIINKLISLYDEEKEMFLKLSSKKEVKYSAFDITFYFLAIFLYSSDFTEDNEYKDMMSSLYKKLFINSGLITCWPEAPTLDDVERYRGLTLKAADMLEENFFRPSTTSTPNSLGVAPIFNKSITYSKKRDEFSISSSSFNSFRNMFINNLIIYLFKDSFMREMGLLPEDLELNNTEYNNDYSTEDNANEKDFEREEINNINNNENPTIETLYLG
ncbi:hypothetical protein [Caproiciproducens sp. MSJ-32]|uniref:hypothetical protein n=1 Tax=Caproiciproducens sp. MSJ-32 TaxID=2841527 RepID=UPI001C101BDC|nr:hypothetical protein [Caproiciproducens sp. MSJ-32]MBU5455992.1 hypothetical protein [Caproiciproducens sp. MSJ-32]